MQVIVAGCMDLSARQAAFLHDTMAEIEDDETRLTSEMREAARIREKAETALTE